MYFGMFYLYFLLPFLCFNKLLEVPTRLVNIPKLYICCLFSAVVMGLGSWPIRTGERRSGNNAAIRHRVRFRVLSGHSGVGSAECYVQPGSVGFRVEQLPSRTAAEYRKDGLRIERTCSPCIICNLHYRDIYPCIKACSL